MRIRPAAEPFDSPDYLFETRWNGIRAMAAVAGGQARLHNGRQGDVTGRFPELEPLARTATEQPLLLDGEIVMIDEHGHPDYDGLQMRLQLANEQQIRAAAIRKPACYLASDIVFRGQRWLVGEPLLRRKRLLADSVHQADCLYIAEYFDTEGRALFHAAVESELEGIIAKPKSGLYTPGDFGGQWLAIGRHREELVIGGYSLRIAGESQLVELLLGAFDELGQLVFVTMTGAPAEEKPRAELFATLNGLQIESPPFTEPPPFIACWVRPEVVITIGFSRREGEREMRYPRFERVRLDIAPEECLLASDAPSTTLIPEREQRPQLTMLSTLPLPLEAPAAGPAVRPRLRLVGER